MGQSFPDSLPEESISSNTQAHLQRRFSVHAHPVYSNNPEFKLLYEKLTNKKYVLRVMTLSDEFERARLEESIFRKIANKSQYLPRLEHYIFEEYKGYCGGVTKCYLFFQLGQFTTLREEILKQPNHRAPFTEQQLIRGMENLILGLLWLRYFKQPHGNINTLNIYCQGGGMFLTDPIIAPANNENPERYISPEKQQKMDNIQEQHDPYVSDVFAIGMCMLEALRGGKMERMYKRNGRLNMELLIQELGKVPFEKLRELLQRLLVIGNTGQFRQIYLEGFTKKFNKSLVGSQNGSEKTNKIHTIGAGIKRTGKTSQADSAFMTANDVNKLQFKKEKSKPKLDEIQPMSNKVDIQSVARNVDKSQLVYRMYPHSDHTKIQPYVDHSKQNQNFITGVRRQNQFDYTATSAGDLNRYDNKPHVNIHYNGISGNTYQQSVYKSYSKQKLIPSLDNLATPIRYAPKFESAASYMPLSHKSEYPKQESRVPFSVANHSLPFTSPLYENSYVNSNSYKSRITAAEGYKMDLSTSGSGGSSSAFNDHYFPNKKTSPAKKYSEHPKFQVYLEKYDSMKKSSSKKEGNNIEIKNIGEIQKIEDRGKMPHLDEKKEKQKEPEVPESVKSNDFQNIIGQNLDHLEEGISHAIEQSIKSLEKKPVTDFDKQEQIESVERPKQENNNKQSQSETVSNLQSIPLITSEVIQSEHQQYQISSHAREERNEYTNQSQEVEQNEPDSQVSLQIKKIPNANDDRLNSVTSSITPDEIIDDEQEQSQNLKTPLKSNNVHYRNNGTIPEAHAELEQSIDQGKSPRKQLGEYREQQYENGGKYCGYIYNGQRNGQGTFHYKDGGYYKGAWSNNAMNGLGKLYYDNGTLAYEGQWYHDEFHGRGKVYNDSFSQIKGEFDYKTFDSYQFFWKMYDGDLSHDIKEGYGKLTFSNNDYFMGQFKGDLPDGTGHYHHVNGQIITGIWEKGQLIKVISQK